MNPREQKIVALGLLVAVLALAWATIAQPILSGFMSRRAERAELAEAFGRDARLVSSFPRLKAVAAAQAASAGAFRFVTADAAAARSAGEAKIAEAVARSGGTVHAVRVEPSTPGEVRLRADATLTLKGLQGLLTTLQDGRPYATVTSLSVATDASAGVLRPSSLEVRIDVIYAYAALRP